MNKTFKKTMSVMLVFMMMLSCLGVSSSAGVIDVMAQTRAGWTMDQAQWDAYFAQARKTQDVLELTPGSDESQMNFSWQSDVEEGKPTVKLSVNPDMSEAVEFKGKAEMAGSRFSNKVTATGLEASTVYYYTYGKGAADSEPECFRTGDADSFTALYCSDVHISEDETDYPNWLSETSYKWHNALEKMINDNTQADFVLSAGDQASRGLASEMFGFYSPTVLRNMPIASCIGNHEKKGYDYGYFGNKPNESKGISTSYIGSDYWFTYNEVLFLVMDSTNGSAVDHLRFVQDAVKANPNAKWRVGMIHHDLYGGAYSRSDSENNLLEALFNPIFSDYDFDIVLTGHSHYYGRTHGMEMDAVVEDYSGVEEITDPEGTIFMVSTTINRVRDDTYPESKDECVAVNKIVNDTIYTTLTFEGDSMEINSYTLADHELVDTLTVHKTEAPENNDEFFGFTIFAGVLGTIYSLVNKFIELFRKMGISF
ncbi:MAG: metallophosphoesterase family protein [Clostridiales bacterium]|nr:metallophosphoesterase family protein [Clostridiales bacterium]